MTIADIGRILGQQDHEHVIDAARRVVGERDEAVAEVERLKAEAESWGNIPLVLQKRREFLRDDRRWELFKIVFESAIGSMEAKQAAESAREEADIALAEFDRASEPVQLYMGTDATAAERALFNPPKRGIIRGEWHRILGDRTKRRVYSPASSAAASEVLV